MVKAALRRALGALLISIPAWLPAAPRVISLSPANTELAFAAGIVPVAVSEHSDYPPAALPIERVANWQGVDSERILTLKPDLILAWRGGNARRPLDQLASQGIRVLWLDPNSVEDIAKALRELAAWSPHPEQALRAADELLAQWQALKTRYRGAPSQKVFVQFGDKPLFTMADGTLQQTILHACGGINIFQGSAIPWPQVSREQVLIRHPDVIVSPGAPPRAAAIGQFWGRNLTVPIIVLNEDWFERAGPRIILAAQALCEALAHKPSH
ncbi:vitamin B12 ABC transporter substrate-binding protein BtuF [Erwinia sp. HR93]|uniref:vitamin B12 ABC transporter substrate-binding protein BtuF n=1 Tax=Erwinia sp. HR93 TaxID=3094840 RepID=UPI002ADECE20|nr:vitamin B12 ABC transporter substrate-binding protein BtuF [Erwinia sp. HR93]MEA1063656.1 vitamin B12 ABC transporter substrate-binding protein BtuF [Erwinia sp. HR93]